MEKRMIQCKTGEVVYNYSDYLKTEHWKKKKQSFLATVKRECMICSRKENLHVHHITYKNIGDERNNQLALLCKTCHFSAHEQGFEKLNEIRELRKIQRKLDIKRIKKGKKWVEDKGFDDIEKYAKHLKESQEKSKKVNELNNEIFNHLKEKYITNKNIKNWSQITKTRKTGEPLKASDQFLIKMKTRNIVDIFNVNGEKIERIDINKIRKKGWPIG